MENITPTRNFNLLYVILDTCFILVLLAVLLWKKRKGTFYFSIFGGILYFIVDFGYFYLISKSRSVYIDGNLCNSFQTALILLWMSLSYGITNFAFIWLCLRRDDYLKEFLIMIIGWWLIAPQIALLSQSMSIKTYRTTTAYHTYMAIILLIGYAVIIINNLRKPKEERVNLLWLNLIGISVQFCWEFALLINNIRPLSGSAISTLIIDSLIETNLGMPIIYGIFKYFKKNKRNKCLLKS